MWTPRVYDPHDEAFGRSLSAAEGEWVLVRLCGGRRNAGQESRPRAVDRLSAGPPLSPPRAQTFDSNRLASVTLVSN